MAERRMFAKSLIDSDLFLDMPLSTQALYFHLSMRADDEGFVNNPKKILRMIGADEDSLRILIAKQFILPFDSGIVVIKHWRIHNYIQKDRFKKTVYTAERAQLVSNENGEYSISDTECIHDVSSLDTQYSIGKVSIDKVSIGEEDGEASASPDSPEKKSNRFVKPTVEQIAAYCQERGNGINAEKFFNYYEAIGWHVGKNPMKNWKAAVRTWEQRENASENKLKSKDSDLDKYKELINDF